MVYEHYFGLKSHLEWLVFLFWLLMVLCVFVRSLPANELKGGTWVPITPELQVRGLVLALDQWPHHVK